MNAANETKDVSIRFTLRLNDGQSVTGSDSGDRFDYKPGAGQIMPAIEEALCGALQGEKRRYVFSPIHDPHLELDATRLAQILGHPGETLILEVEIL